MKQSNDTAQAIEKELLALADLQTAEHSQRFFKTGKGQYGEGDRFLGIRVPVLRKVVKRYQHVSYQQTAPLIQSPWHEVRLFALLHWVDCFKKGDSESQQALFELYLQSSCNINNWDLVDTTAPHIVGAYLLNRDQSILYEMALSSLLWERRIAIVATYTFIKAGQFDCTLAIAQSLLADKEDLMHKAVGWMLREVGKQDVTVLKGFIRQHYHAMPRTMLRYAIEKFPEPERLKYLHGKL